MSRANYNAYIGALETLMQNHGATPSYEQAVEMATRYGGVSPQEASATLYNLYGQYGPRPGARYMPQAPAPVYQGGGGTRYASGGSRRVASSGRSGGGAVGPRPEDLRKAKEAYDRTIESIMRKKDAQLKSYEDMLTDLLTKEKELGKQKDQGIAGNSAYFNKISPDAYQSQQVNYNNKVMEAFNEGLAQTGRNKTRIGEAKGNFVADINDMLWNAAQEYKGNLGGYQGKEYQVTPPVVPNDPITANPLAVSTAGIIPYQAAGPNQINKGVPVNPWDFLK